MARCAQSLMNCLLRVGHRKLCLKPCSVENGSLASLKSSFIRHHVTYIIPVCEVPLVGCLENRLANTMVCNKWSISNSTLIQRSPNFVYYNGTRRFYATGRNRQSRSNRTTLVYSTAIAIVVLGLSYAAVPLYRMFCQVRYFIYYNSRIVALTGLPIGYSVIVALTGLNLPIGIQNGL